MAASEVYPPYPSSTSTKPYTALATVPETITGPAMVNIFTIVPVISPSACVKTKLFYILLCYAFSGSERIMEVSTTIAEHNGDHVHRYISLWHQSPKVR